MEFQLSCFKSWKMMLWKCCTQYANNFGKLSSGHRLEKVSSHSNPKEGQRQKYSNYHTTALISHASKVMAKILQARLQQYVDRELLDVQVEFRKERGSRSKCQHPLEKAREFQKTSISALLTMPKPLTVWTTTNSGKFWKRWEYQATWPASWEICMQVKKQLLELDMEQQTTSK